MTPIVLTEGNSDERFLAKLIAQEQHESGVEIRVAGALNSLYSVARTLLAVRRIPVAVVIDADSAEPEMVDDRQQRAEEVIGDAASGVPFRVILAVPELSVLFFQRPELLRRVFGEAVDDHVIELGQLSPRHAFGKLGKDKPIETIRAELLEAMDADDIQALRQTHLIKDLLDFLNTTAARSNRPAVAGLGNPSEG